MNSHSQTCFPFTNNCNEFNIPKRCEPIRYIQMDMKEECLTFSAETHNGIYLASSVATPVNLMAPIQILHITENDLLLPEINPTVHKLRKFGLCSLDRNDKSADRVKKVFSKLWLGHLNE